MSFKMVLRIRYLEIEISVYGKILQGFQAISFIKNGPIPASFLFIFVLFSLQTEKSVDGLLGIQTCGCRMVGADNTNEL